MSLQCLPPELLVIVASKLTIADASVLADVSPYIKHAIRGDISTRIDAEIEEYAGTLRSCMDTAMILCQPGMPEHNTLVYLREQVFTIRILMCNVFQRPATEVSLHYGQSSMNSSVFRLYFDTLDGFGPRILRRHSDVNGTVEAAVRIIFESYQRPQEK